MMLMCVGYQYRVGYIGKSDLPWIDVDYALSSRDHEAGVPQPANVLKGMLPHGPYPSSVESRHLSLATVSATPWLLGDCLQRVQCALQSSPLLGAMSDASLHHSQVHVYLVVDDHKIGILARLKAALPIRNADQFRWVPCRHFQGIAK